MKKIIIACGVVSILIWLTVTFVTRGIPLGLCEGLSSFMPDVLRDEIMKMKNGFYYDIANKHMPQTVFLFLFTLVFVIYFSLFLKLSNHPVNYAPLIIFFAIVFRSILLPSVMIHENDIYRYIWDGKVLLGGINPYKYAPDVATGGRNERSDLKRMSLFGFARSDIGVSVSEVKKLKSIKKENPIFFYRIGHKEVPTIYPPFAQLIFSASNLIKRNSILVMKSIFMIFDILTISLIYKILILLKMNPNNLIVYAWSPLVLKEFTNSGHLDPIAIFFLLGALFFMLPKKRFLSIVSLSFGVLSKFFPLVTLPLFFKRIKWRWAICLVIFIIAGYFPFFLMGAISPLQVFKGLFTYAREWSINGGIFEFLYSLVYTFNLNAGLSADILAKIIIAALYLVILFFICRGKITDERVLLHRVFWSIAILFLLSPVGNPWYFCWVIPFLCFFPYRSFVILSYLLIFSYASFVRNVGFVSLGPLEMDALVAFQYAPFFILLFLEILCLRIKKFAY